MTAPYTFVPFTEPLPAGALGADPAGNRHDRPVDGRRTGHIDLTATALSPLFVGAATGDTFLTLGGHPTIAGSSIKGLLRSTLAAMIGTDIGPQPNADKHFWYRNPVKPSRGRGEARVDNARIAALATAYHQRREGEGQPDRQRIGLLRATQDGHWEIRECARLHLPLPEHLSKPHNTHYTALPKVRRTILTHDLGTTRFTADDPALSTINDHTVHVVWAAVRARGADYYDKGQRKYVRRPVTVRRVPYAVGTDPKRAQQNAAHRRAGGLTHQSLPESCIAVDTAFVAFLDRNGHQATACETESIHSEEMVLHATALVHDATSTTVNAYLFALPGSATDTWIAATWTADTTKNKGRAQPRPKTLPVPQDVVDVLDDEDQLTPYQNKLPEWKPLARTDTRVGIAGLPVFFDLDTKSGEVCRIGRSGGIRLSAAHTLVHALPEHTRPRGGGNLDAVHTLLGEVNDTTTVASRVQCGHLVCTGTTVTLATATIPLLSPKIEAWHTRLHQPPVNPDNPVMMTWDGRTDTGKGTPAYRGREIYLHRWDRKSTDTPDAHAKHWQQAIADHAKIAPDGATNTGGKTDTTITPLAPGASFTGRIRFVNLTDAELGAILTALTLANNPTAAADDGEPVSAHKIGAAKPLGLGSVHLTPRLVLTDTRRYRSTTTHTDTGIVAEAADASDETVEPYVEAFRDALAQHTNPKTWTEALDNRKWPPAITALLRATQWASRPPRKATAEMTVKEHAARRTPAPLDALAFTGPDLPQPTDGRPPSPGRGAAAALHQQTTPQPVSRNAIPKPGQHLPTPKPGQHPPKPGPRTRPAP